MANLEIIKYIKDSFKLKNQGFYKPSIEMLYKALAIEPENIEILVQLAHLYKLLNNNQKSIYYIEKVLDKDSKNIDCMNLLQEIYIAQNELDLAYEISNKVYELCPIQENLAKKINILNKLDNYDEITKIENSSTNLSDIVLYEIAIAHYNNYNVLKATQLLEFAYTKNNLNTNVIFLLGKIHYENNEKSKAKKYFDILEKNYKSPEVMNFLGMFKLEENKFDKAIEYFTKAQKLDGNNAEYTYNIASAYLLKGWLDEAIKLFNKSVCQDPDNINYHYSLAYAYYQKNLFDKASNELDLIYSIEQNHQPSNVLKAMILGKNGNLLQAKEQLENIIKYSEADDFAYFALSQVYSELFLYKKAKDALKKAIELKPQSLNYLGELINIEINEKNYEDVISLANKIIDINSKYIFAYIAKAKTYLALEDYDNLYTTAQDIIQLDSNCPDGYYYNSIALFDQEDRDFAIESLKKSISLDLNNAQLYIKMSEFYQELGNFKEAYAWALEAKDIDERNYKYKWICAKLAATLDFKSDASKLYSQSFLLAPGDTELRKDYSEYLKSIGKNKQAEKILK